MSRLAVLVSLCYPAIVFFGSRYLPPALLALILLPLLLRAFSLPGQWILIPTVAGLGLAAVVLGSHLPLKLYPVAMNLGLLTIFALSLRHPPTVIERFARLKHPDLPPAGVAYTRQVTWAWCLFFLVNGSIALVTVLMGSDLAWFWYNGVIAYLLIGAMFAGELLVRRSLLQAPHE